MRGVLQAASSSIAAWFGEVEGIQLSKKLQA